MPIPRKSSLHSFTFSAVSLLLLFGVYVWIAVAGERHALRLAVQEQGKQLALSLEDAVDVVRSHVFTARRTVEHALLKPGAGKMGHELIQAESGALFADPKVDLKSEPNSRNLAAAAMMLPAAAAAHQWSPIFKATYYYDSQSRWLVMYPFLSNEDLFRSTKTGDLSAAIRVALDGDGTRPVELVGPRSNSGREMRWTPPYEDPVGRGRMVSLLAPIYLGNDYVGAIGTDVTVNQLDVVLKSHAPEVGRTLVVDEHGIILADSGRAMKDVAQPVKAADAFPELGSLPPGGDVAWQRLPLRGTQWTLWVHATESELNNVVVGGLTPSFLIAGLLFIALLVLLRMQQSRHKELAVATDALDETRTALARADRLGAIGGLIGGVSREISTPLQQSAQTVASLQSSLAGFCEQQQRGLRRSELEDFVAQVGQSGEQLSRHIHDANDLLQRFRQLAIDQASEEIRQFRPRDVADNVLAVMRPVLKRVGCRVDNSIAADLVATDDVGRFGQILHYLLNDVAERGKSGEQWLLAGGWNAGRHGEVVEIALSGSVGAKTDERSEHLALASRLVEQVAGGEVVVSSGEDGYRVLLRLPVKS